MFEQYRRGGYMPVGFAAPRQRPQTYQRDNRQDGGGYSPPHDTQRDIFIPQPERREKDSASPLSGLLGSLTGGLLPADGKLFGLDTTDILVCAVFLLLYMESRDVDFLILLGVFAFGMTGRSL